MDGSGGAVMRAVVGLRRRKKLDAVGLEGSPGAAEDRRWGWFRGGRQGPAVRAGLDRRERKRKKICLRLKTTSVHWILIRRLTQEKKNRLIVFCFSGD